MNAVDLLAWLMDDAFAGGGLEASNESQSLLANLAAVTDAQWRARVAGSTRTIEAIALHVGACKRMYANHAFEDGRLTWESAVVAPWKPGAAPREGAICWLREEHERLMRHVRALGDADLMARRRANWGEERETRWLLSILLQHDTYHAGEINHLRGLLAGEDRWRWQIDLGIDPEPGDLAGTVPPWRVNADALEILE
jgi:uncharacterized damage-inducible protein DinB